VTLVVIKRMGDRPVPLRVFWPWRQVDEPDENLLIIVP